MLRKAGLLLMLAGMLGLSACAGGRAYVVRTPPPPPPPHAAYVGVAPGPRYVWTDGYWAWNGRWHWVPGRWLVPPRRHTVWVPGRWERSHGGYVWYRGYWR